MILDTKRLRLRLVNLSDLEQIHKLHTIPEIDQYNTLGIPTNIEVTQVVVDEWLDAIRLRREYVFVITSTIDNIFIGLISIRIGNPKYKIATVWYKLQPEFWGHGYATEALQRILRLGFEKLHLHRIEAGCAINNIGSIRVLEKSGMTREGMKRKVLPLKTGWSDNYEFAILDEDWNQKN